MNTSKVTAILAVLSLNKEAELPVRNTVPGAIPRPPDWYKMHKYLPHAPAPKPAGIPQSVLSEKAKRWTPEPNSAAKVMQKAPTAAEMAQARQAFLQRTQPSVYKQPQALSERGAGAGDRFIRELMPSTYINRLKDDLVNGRYSGTN